MSLREKWMVAAAVAAVLSLVIFHGMVKPVTGFHERKQHAVAVKTDLLGRMKTLSAEYRLLQNRQASVQGNAVNQAENFNLFSFLEKVAGGAGLKERIGYMKPATRPSDTPAQIRRVVEMKLQGIDIGDLVTFLHGVEAANVPVTIHTLSVLKAGEAGEHLSVIVKCESVEWVDSEKGV